MCGCVCVNIKKLIVYRKINGFAISSRRAYAAAAVWLSLMVVSVTGERILAAHADWAVLLDLG